MQCPDEELAQKWKDGDISAFESLFERYERRVLNVAARMIGGMDDAEDVTQETFIRAHKSIGGFRGGKFSTWLFRIATNQCLDRAKRKGAKTCSLDDLIETHGWREPQGPTQDDPEEQLVRNEFRTCVRKVLGAIPPHYRILLVLRHIDGMTYEEIAEVAGCSVGSLGVRLHRAKEMFKGRMKPFLEGSARDEVQRSKTEDFTVL